jgi:hypothetical protein
VIHSSDKPDLILRHATSADLDRVKCLWHALYRHQFSYNSPIRRKSVRTVVASEIE